MLSTKLINAINHSTSLDDNLQHSRHELEAARSRIAQLEAEAKEHAESVASGVLLKKAEVDATMAQLRAELQEAKKEREASDKAKRQMETEVENLTSALFEEANTVSVTKLGCNIRLRILTIADGRRCTKRERVRREAQLTIEVTTAGYRDAPCIITRAAD